MADKPVIFLLGPTACGKTASSIVLAQKIDAEIISVDSALVYRGMDIGTAKPTMAERDGVVHHLIDICDPNDVYSAARFREDALSTIDDVQRRGKQALLTGGTMLYFRALETGIAPLPNADPAVRDALAGEAEKIGWPAMHDRLASIDPDAAKRIHPNDPQRLQRALEVYELTGVPLTALQKNTVSPLGCKPIKFALVPDDRSWLHSRVEHRFEMMLDAGFLDEVKDLNKRFKLDPALPAMRSVGYRQALEHITGEIDYNTMMVKAQAATRQLAKRQLTWIRGMTELVVVNCDSISTGDQVDLMVGTLAQRQ